MDELLAFVHARLDELEDAARCAPGPEWWEDEKVYKWGDDAEPEVWCRKGLIAKISREAPTAPEHILLNDPARILRDVEARRTTLIRCQEEMLSGIPRLVWFAKMTVWEMAKRWADHEAFKEGWKP